MAVNALVADWINNYNGAGGIKIVWEDGHSNTFLDMAEVKAYISDLDASAVNAERLLIAWFLARSADASNTNLVEGKRLTFDLTNAQPIRVQ